MDVVLVKSDAAATNFKTKPAVPKKPEKLSLEYDVSRKTHVRDLIRKLQEKEVVGGSVKPNFLRKPGKTPPGPEKEEMGVQASSQTLEDLKAIDEDIEKLRKQIEERDKIISALREAAEAKDKKLDKLMLEYSKLQSNGKLEMVVSPEPNRVTSLSPSSPPLCNGELCWTDSFVNKNYHEPVYAQLLNDHTALQKVYNELRTKFESKNSEVDCQKTEGEGKTEGGENAINLIMAEQIKALKEREAQLIWEAEELREQNDLMEFRILELEECRKEFLDKEMMNEGKHRGEKIVWRERDIEEVSDSGVMSLPTSEDLTSDSELGEAIRNYSPLGPVSNLGVSISESSDSGISDSKLKKSLKSSEYLQESGIFVDSESPISECAIPTGRLSKACQTESVLDKTLLDIIDSSCDLFLSKNPGYLEDSKSDDLSTELSKLSVIQKRIQQKTKPPRPRNPHTVVSCPHSNSLLFYEERLAQLEDKLKIYESSGDTKDALLAKRLHKEVELAHQVKELTNKVTLLETTKRKLEEEKCEFEEAENDARFQCQRLEIRLQEFIEKNTELKLEIERQKVIMNEERRREKKKGSLEGLLSKYEQRNFELEEKELEAKQRLSMIEAAMPAIIAYNVFKMVQKPTFGDVLLNKENEIKSNRTPITDPIVFQRLEEVLNDQKKLRKDYKKVAESAVDREKSLRSKIEELEAKAEKDREKLEEMTNTLKAFKLSDKSERVGSIAPDDLFEELKLMVANELQLKAEIERMEKNEQVYMHSLEKADEIWAGMEADYKKRLKEAEDANNELQKRVSQLEKTQAELEKTLVEQTLSSNVKNEDLINFQELLSENEKLKLEISRNLDEKFEEHKKFLEMENTSLKEELKKMEAESMKEGRNYHRLREELSATREELEREKEVGERLRKDLEEKTQSVTSLEVNLQGQISDLTQELNQKSKELSSLEVTVAELREEVETLENKVAELVETIQTSIKNHDEDASLPVGEAPWALPLEEQVSLVRVEQKNPFSVNRVQQVTAVQKAPVVNEIFVKEEKHFSSNSEILAPVNCHCRLIVSVALPSPRQEMRYVFSYSTTQTEIFLTRAFKAEVINRSAEIEREEKIFQLSLKNTELQQVLERMEEESKWKDREFEELHKIVLEIRREQENLQELYKLVEKEEEGEVEQELKAEPKRKESAVRVRDDSSTQAEPKEKPVDFLQVITPIVSKTSEQLYTTISSLQIAFDNLQSKYRSTNFLFKPLFDQLRQKGDNKDIDQIDRQLSLQHALDIALETSKEKPNSEPETGVSRAEEKKTEEKAVAEVQTDEDLAPKAPAVAQLGKSTAAMLSVLTSSYSKHRSSKSMEVDPDFFFAAPITIIRKIGDDGIFLEWDVAQQPPNVTGFEIRVNGLLMHRVRSPSRNKAFLRPLNLKEKISIHVFAISENGRSMKSSHVTCPDEYFLLNSN